MMELTDQQMAVIMFVNAVLFIAFVICAFKYITGGEDE